MYSYNVVYHYNDTILYHYNVCINTVYHNAVYHNCIINTASCIIMLCLINTLSYIFVVSLCHILLTQCCVPLAQCCVSDSPRLRLAACPVSRTWNVTTSPSLCWLFVVSSPILCSVACLCFLNCTTLSLGTCKLCDLLPHHPLLVANPGMLGVWNCNHFLGGPVPALVQEPTWERVHTLRCSSWHGAAC